MSDNMSTTEQAAATKTKSPAIDTVPSTSEVAQPEVASQADSEATTIKDDTAVLTEGFHFKSTDSVDSSTSGATDTPAAIAEADVSPTKTSPKKRVAAKAADDESPKKRARAIKPKPVTEVNPEDDQSKSPVKKGRAAKAKTPTTEPKVKSESEGTSSTAVDEDAMSDAVPEPKTPKKGGRASKAKTPAEPKTPKTPKNTRAAKEPKSAERKRATPGKVADKVPLPTTWATASGADKMLVKMKEEGKSWNEIRETWQTMTGQETAGSTLPNRYKRLQVVMMHLEDGEKDILLAAKHEVESNWKNSKWVSIAAKMEEKGAKKYPTEFIQKEFKKIQADTALAAAAGVERGVSALSADATVLLSAALKASVGWSEEDEEVEE